LESASQEQPRGPDRTGDSTAEGDRRVILLVEDMEADRDVYGGLLWYNGYEVVHAGDGESALAKARETRPDLILLDIRLPGLLSGLDVAAQLRREGFETPMVVLSAVQRDELGPEVERSGVGLYLEKPIDPFDVVRAVMKVVGPAQGDRR
jgi:CheY-like chemotaxis protein